MAEYKCGFCGKVYSTVKERIDCEINCNKEMKRHEEEARKANLQNQRKEDEKRIEDLAKQRNEHWAKADSIQEEINKIREKYISVPFFENPFMLFFRCL